MLMASRSPRMAEKAQLAALQLKRCSKCKKVYPLDETYFYRNRRYGDGLNCQCRACVDEWGRKREQERYANDANYRADRQAKRREIYHRHKFDPVFRQKERERNHRNYAQRKKEVFKMTSDTSPVGGQIKPSTVQTVGFMALHYGLDYIQYAIRSVIDQVDQFYIAYSPEGSHGRRSEQRCPETDAQLIRAAREVAGDKLVWYTGDWHHEGEQRNSIFEKAPQADLILIVDSDEIWRADMVARVLRAAREGTARHYLVRGVHFWRSFWRAVIDDHSSPTRVINTRREGGSQELNAWFNHMGYATRPDIVEYKWLIHGHKPEERQDVNWYRDIFMANRLTDCHPTNHNFWNTVSVDPLNWLPGFMAEHPWFDKEVIE